MPPRRCPAGMQVRAACGPLLGAAHVATYGRLYPPMLYLQGVLSTLFPRYLCHS
jgi:hypothetical protein